MRGTGKQNPRTAKAVSVTNRWRKKKAREKME